MTTTTTPHSITIHLVSARYYLELLEYLHYHQGYEDIGGILKYIREAEGGTQYWINRVDSTSPDGLYVTLLRPMEGKRSFKLRSVVTTSKPLQLYTTPSSTLWVNSLEELKDSIMGYNDA